MNGVFTDIQARIARIGGIVGALVALVLLAFAFWVEAEVARLYVSPLLFFVTCAAFYLAGRQRQRALEALALGLFGVTLLAQNLPALVAGLRGDASTSDFLIEGVFGSAMALFFLGLAAVVFFEMEYRFSGRDA
jgi:hypothetical protein